MLNNFYAAYFNRFSQSRVNFAQLRRIFDISTVKIESNAEFCFSLDLFCRFENEIASSMNLYISKVIRSSLFDIIIDKILVLCLRHTIANLKQPISQYAHSHSLFCCISFINILTFKKTEPVTRVFKTLSV